MEQVKRAKLKVSRGAKKNKDESRINEIEIKKTTEKITKS
jgi:hypothetical protein